jgi:hypothetical protein
MFDYIYNLRPVGELYYNSIGAGKSRYRTVLFLEIKFNIEK